MNTIPVITIDGPSASGKGTISRLLARQLKWHFLDSGLLYRVLALAAKNHKIGLDNEPVLAKLAMQLDVKFYENPVDLSAQVTLEGQDVTEEIRTEECGNMASQVGVFLEVRQALLQRQRDFRKAPGLVADGRDMGSVIFPDAVAKFFLVATPEIRAKRRYDQLKKTGNHVNLDEIINEMRERDLRDKARTVAPLKPAEDAILVETSDLSIQEVLLWIQKQVDLKYQHSY